MLLSLMRFLSGYKHRNMDEPLVEQPLELRNKPLLMFEYLR